MDGFENIVARGLGFESVLLPAVALVGYAVAFFALAVWRLSASGGEVTVVRSYLTSAMSDQELKAVFALIWQTWVNTYNTEYPNS